MRVKLRLKTLVVEAPREEIESPALVNSGFGTEGPELVLPPAAAERLGLWGNDCRVV